MRTRSEKGRYSHLEMFSSLALHTADENIIFEYIWKLSYSLTLNSHVWRMISVPYELIHKRGGKVSTYLHV